LKFVVIETPLLITPGFYEQIMSIGWVDLSIKGAGDAVLINEADILSQAD